MSGPTIEKWRVAWRQGFAPCMPVEVLRCLLAGLESDDEALVQGSTTVPPPLMCVADWVLEGGCAVCYGFWKAGLAETVGQGEQCFADACFDCDQRLGEPAACRWFLNWFDEASRADVRRELAAEVTLAIENLYAGV